MPVFGFSPIDGQSERRPEWNCIATGRENFESIPIVLWSKESRVNN